MDPITLIVAALAAGAASGALDEVKDGAKAGLKAAYEKLRGLARRRVAGDQLGELVLAAHENAPDTYTAPLTERLAEHGAADDADLVAAAKAVMDLIDAAGAKAGKYNVTVNNSHGVQVGDGNTQINRF